MEKPGKRKSPDRIGSLAGGCITVTLVILLLALPGSPVVAYLQMPINDRHETVETEEVVNFEDMHLTQEDLSTLLLPDLRTLPPTDLRLEIDRRNEVRLLRFANTIWNSGRGPLEMLGDRPSGADNVKVTQLILTEDGSAVLYEAGHFHYHVTHGHWHWENFSLYQVWTVAPDGRLVDLVAYSDKVGYCLFDVSRYRGSFANAVETPRFREYLECNPIRQGLSVGWTDTYRAHLPGQYVDISHLADGMYALRSVVDPGGLILEENYANNAAVVYFILSGERVEQVDGPPGYLQPASAPR